MSLPFSREDIRRAFEHLIRKFRVPSLFDPVYYKVYYTDEIDIENFSLHELFLKELTKGERSSHVTNLAISFFAFMIWVPYPGLRDLYFSKKALLLRT